MTSVVCSNCHKERPVFDRLCPSCWEETTPDEAKVTRERSKSMIPKTLRRPPNGSVRR